MDKQSLSNGSSSLVRLCSARGCFRHKPSHIDKACSPLEIYEELQDSYMSRLNRSLVQMLQSCPLISARNVKALILLQASGMWPRCNALASDHKSTEWLLRLFRCANFHSVSEVVCHVVSSLGQSIGSGIGGRTVIVTGSRLKHVAETTNIQQTTL